MAMYAKKHRPSRNALESMDILATSTHAETLMRADWNVPRNDGLCFFRPFQYLI